MIISMQGSWKVQVTTKSAAFPQRFVINGADSGNGTYEGVVGKTANVTGAQWTIAVQNDPGTGFQLSDTKLMFPRKVGTNYTFEIRSNDAGSDSDFNDLILTCSTPVNINDFIIYGNVSFYSGRCIFNPCRKGPFVIETAEALLEALKNTKLRKIIEKDYLDRIPREIDWPRPPGPGPGPGPDPGPFKPIVIDLSSEAAVENTQLLYKMVEPQAVTKKAAAAKEETLRSPFAAENFTLVDTIKKESALRLDNVADRVALAKAVDDILFRRCTVEPATNLTLSFEEYDRTTAELAGGPYTGEGNRRLLGDAVTDANGNYIFRFSFDMTFPDIEDPFDIAPGESISVVAYPDVIAKIISFTPYEVIYESAPYYNIANFKRIDLCVPKPKDPPASACFNGNLIGSLGNVFLGGNQNAGGSFLDAALKRYGDGNNLEPSGKISVGSALAGFKVDCACWSGTIDIKGCMYDAAKTATENNIKWYTIRIKRDGTSDWNFVSENYKHPKFSNRNLPNYIGDDVGPDFKLLHVDGGAPVTVPAYRNIQREIYVDGVDWEYSNSDRYMQLHTTLYDVVAGVRTPGRFFVRVDCYDGAGNPVLNGTDMIALYIHNLGLNFGLSVPEFTSPSVLYAGCGLYRLEESQMNEPIKFAFRANDPYGFIDRYALTMGRCPTPMIGLQVNSPKPPLADTTSGQTTLSSGDASANVFHTCVGYAGTLDEFSTADPVEVEIQPASSEGGWLKSGEYFSSLTFYLVAYKRRTNGYNSGLTDNNDYLTHTHILMERKGS